MKVNIHYAKTHLSRLIESALAGEDVVIAKAGRPMVRLIPVAAAKPVLGSAKGLIILKRGWESPMTDAEIEETFGA